MSTKTRQQPPASLLRHLRGSDLRGAARLATAATAGVTRMVEGVHAAVLQSLGASPAAEPGRTSGLTGLVYRGVHGANRLVGQGLEHSLAALEPLFVRLDGEPPGTPEREAVLAALNGVIGDRLAATDNPLATTMSLRQNGQPLSELPAASDGRYLLLIHGLCMNDLQWQREGREHGRALAEALGLTPIYLRYNTGRPVADNGHALALLLEHHLAPVPNAHLDVLCLSMGGLVMRRTLQSAELLGLQWPKQLGRIVFLGTPHLGAPLERAGHGVDLLLGSTRYTAPLARLGRLRSAGITDLRHGIGPELQLPATVACFSYAATLATRRGAIADRLLGDGLVPLRSALGQLAKGQQGLAFAPDRQAIGYRMGHLELLSRPEVTAQLQIWLA